MSYTLQAPLVTPDLYEIGPARVHTVTLNFSEARVWYLAIDPTTVTNVTPASCTITDDPGSACTASLMNDVNGGNENMQSDGTTVYMTVRFTTNIPSSATGISATAWIRHRNDNNGRVSDEEIHYNGTGAWVQQGTDLT